VNLIIDTGNTFTKLALYQGIELVAFTSFEGLELKYIKHFCDSNAAIQHAIVSTVKEYPPEIESFLNQQYHTIFFNHLTPVPVSNKYQTPASLGKDRLAAVVGATQLMPGSTVLVIDAGTAITYDLVTAEGIYLGGGISPGIAMRYKALHTFTARLPLLNPEDTAPLIGIDTASSIHSGVLNGTIAELEGIIQRYQSVYPGLKTIVTGGDHNYFDKRLKIKTFAAPNLVIEGLNLILHFNIETH
jgi:type III pantothenate kinase